MRKVALLSFFFFFLLFCSALPEMQARPLPVNGGSDDQKFVFRSMKNAGPNKGGPGHKRLRHFQIFREIKESGPSPGGAGHH